MESSDAVIFLKAPVVAAAVRVEEGEIGSCADETAVMAVVLADDLRPGVPPWSSMHHPEDENPE